MNILSGVVAIVVTYHPTRSTLSKLVNALKIQVEQVVIIDNGSNEAISEWFDDHSSKLHLIELDNNLGIASAQNIGIKWANDHGAEYIVLFDQDSDLDKEMIPVLHRAIKALQDDGKKVACVGPSYIDLRQNNPTPFIRIEGLRLVRESCRSLDDVVPVDHLIASGCLIPLSTLDEVGLMEESLFIDYVDLEWCERAKFKGYQSFGVCAAQMEHALGDDPIEFMGRGRPARSPLRHYYMCRNAMWIYQQSWPRWNWKLVDGMRLVRKFIFYSIFARPRQQHIKMMCLGLWHGAIGKMGKYSP